MKDFFELRENKIFFVKVGDGRDSMTVKTKASNSREALKNVRSKHPKDKVSLDSNQKQGQPAGTFESVKTEDKGQKAGMFESADTKAEVQKKQDFLDRLRGKPPVKKESSVEYGKSVDRIRDKQKNAAIKPKDRETLGKLADLMKKQKRNEAYRKPTQAEIDADKKKDGKSKDSSTRYRDMKKKVYGNAIGGLRKEETTLNLEEGLVKVTDVEFNYRDQLPNSPKTSDLGAIKWEWQQDSRALRDAVKKMGGLVTNTVAPSRGNKWVGTVTIGTRDDPSKLDDKSIQKAVKSHGIEIHSNQFRESTDLEEQKYAVKYTHPTDKKSGKTTGPLSKAAADKKAAMGNRVDRVGGKYTVIPHVESASLKKEDWRADSARRMRNKQIANGPYRRPKKDTRTDAERMADRAKLAKRFAADKAKQDKAVASKKESVEESTMADRRVFKAVRIAKDMAGNHTGATRAIEKLKKGLSNHPKVRDALRTHNESVRSADKKPQNYRDPETGKMKVRMVAVDRDISSKKANESVELEERTNAAIMTSIKKV